MVSTCDLRTYQSHQRNIVRHFAPHLTNEQLTRQENFYLMICIVRVLFVFALPTICVVYLVSWFIKTPIFFLIIVISIIHLLVALHRYCILWPEGLRLRWNYWHEIEQSQDFYKLKILGYYHRKMARIIGQFPTAISSEDIKIYYRKRGILHFALFAASYFTSMCLLIKSDPNDSNRIYLLYALSMGSGLVLMRYTKMQLIEIPQVLHLRDRPEFAVDLMLPGEAVPFARRPVPSYQTTASASTSDDVTTSNTRLNAST